MNKKKLPLAFWIFIGLVVGIAVGLALMMVPNGLDIAKNYILPWGTIFLNLLKFIVVPIVLFSIASGVISMQDIGRVGSVGGKTIVYYMCTTAFAVVLALCWPARPRGCTSLRPWRPPAWPMNPRRPSLMQTIIDIFPSNPIHAAGQCLHAPGHRHLSPGGLRHPAGGGKGAGGRPGGGQLQ